MVSQTERDCRIILGFQVSVDFNFVSVLQFTKHRCGQFVSGFDFVCCQHLAIPYKNILVSLWDS
jgi:hypothetical protein